MARKPLKGMKKAKMSRVRKDIKKQTAERLKRKEEERKQKALAGTKLQQEKVEEQLDRKVSKIKQKAIDTALKMYNNPNQKILLIGEGNFSFARALCSEPFGCFKNAFSERSVVATCYDSKDVLVEKYPDAKENIKAIKNFAKEQRKSAKAGMGSDEEASDSEDEKDDIDKFAASVCVNVDARSLSKVREGAFEDRFDKIIFQFPHLGLGEKDQKANIDQHRAFLVEFFQEAEKCLNKTNQMAEVHVTLKEGEPYKQWKIGPCCTEATGGKLQIKTAVPFEPTVFPGYAHRRTLGFRDDTSKDANEEILKTGAKTYIFGWNKNLVLVENAEKDDDE